jgi:hypothetical protein
MLTLLLTACNRGELSTDQRKSAEDALKALRKVEAATEAGVSFMNYQPLVIDAKAQVNEASSKLPDGELKKELNGAADAYADSMTVWQAWMSGQFFKDDFSIDNRNPLVSLLMNKYQIKPETQDSLVAVYDRGKVMPLLWTESHKHIERATKLLSE